MEGAKLVNNVQVEVRKDGNMNERKVHRGLRSVTVIFDDHNSIEGKLRMSQTRGFSPKTRLKRPSFISRQNCSLP